MSNWLLAVLASNVLALAVVVSVTATLPVGVHWVTQLMAGDVLKNGLAGVLQVVVAPAGAPVTTQVGAAAVPGPVLAQVVVTLTGVPTTAFTVAGPLATMSALAPVLVTVQVMVLAASAGKTVSLLPVRLPPPVQLQALAV